MLVLVGCVIVWQTRPVPLRPLRQRQSPTRHSKRRLEFRTHRRSREDLPSAKSATCMAETFFRVLSIGHLAPPYNTQGARPKVNNTQYGEVGSEVPVSSSGKRKS